MNMAEKFQWPTVFGGLRDVKLTDIPREVSSGITLAALIIPLNIGYAQIAGLPPVFGLYAGIIPLVVFAIFTSSPHVVASPDAPIAAILGAVLIGFAPIGDPLRVQYALAISVMCGMMFFLFWFFRLAFLANFLSRAVLAGFISGLGIEVLTNQIRKILGVAHTQVSGLDAIAEHIHNAIANSVNTTGFFVELITLFESIPHANLYSFEIGLGTFVIVLLMKKYFPKIPAALIALIFMTTIVSMLGLDKKGVSVLGSMPSGIPSLTIPSLPLFGYLHLLPGVMAVVGITLCEALLLVRSCNRKHETKADGNQVLFAYGITSVVSGFTGSLISGPSASRTAAMDSAGSCSQLSSIVAAITVALVMVFFTKELAHLPSAALAGVVASSVLNLIEVKEFRELWWMRRSEFWVAAVCLLSVLVFGPLRAVLIAFLLATIDLLRRVSMPSTWVLQEALDGSHFVPEERDHAPANSGIIFYRFGAPLYFANATFFEEEVEKLLIQACTPVKWFVLDMEAMVDIDTTGEEVLHHVLTSFRKKGVTVALTRPNQSTTNLLLHYNLNSLIDESRIYPTNRHAISAFRQETIKLSDIIG